MLSTVVGLDGDNEKPSGRGCALTTPALNATNAARIKTRIEFFILKSFLNKLARTLD